jgi:hypothetical protein
MIQLKNRGNGPRGVINVNSTATILPVDPNRDFDPVEVEVDDITAQWLEEVSERGGDLQVVSAPVSRKSKGGEPEGRAKLSLKPEA